MGEENRGSELPQRERGTARTGPSRSAPSPSPVLSEELRQRLQAAVRAERAEASREQERTTESPRRGTRAASAADEAANPPGHGGVNGINGKRNGAVGIESAVRPQSALEPEPVQPQPALEPEPVVQPQPVVQPPKKPGRHRVSARLVASVLAVLVIGSLVVVIARHFARSPAGSAPPSAAQLRQEAAVRQEAVTWIVQQVSQDVTVSCDKAMCAALTAAGFPARELVVLGPTSPDPVPAVLVVETAAVRDLFGSSLAMAWAPAVVASFGSGNSGITVRVVAAHGAAAYQIALNADLAARKTAEAELLNDTQITVSAAARNQLVAGQVDSRLMLALASLAGHEPIDILLFGNIGPGASAGIPLRFADLAESDQAAHMGSPAYLRAMRADLSAVPAQARPTRTVTVPSPVGGTVLRVEFTAPSPLGLLGTQRSP